MNPDIELALRKQRLLLRSAQLRDELSGHAAGVAPLFAAGDRVRDAALWVRDHGKILAAVGLALIAARPRAALRWVRRSVVVWQSLRRARAWLEHRAHGMP